MSPKSYLLAIVASLAVTSTTTNAALVVSINFVGSNRGSDASRTLLSTDVAGAYSAANWNNVTSQNSPAFMSDSTGIATTITVSHNAGTWGSEKISATPATAGEKLFKGYLDIAGPDNLGNGKTITLSGLDAAQQYLVYVYSDGENNNSGSAQLRSGTFTLGGVSTTITDGVTGGVENTFSGTYTPVAAGTSAEGNYTVFTISGSTVYNLSAVGSFSASPNPVLRAPVNGIQIVAVPEPATALLGVIGIAPLLRRRRR